MTSGVPWPSTALLFATISQYRQPSIGFSFASDARQRPLRKAVGDALPVEVSCSTSRAVMVPAAVESFQPTSVIVSAPVGKPPAGAVALTLTSKLPPRLTTLT